MVGIPHDALVASESDSLPGGARTSRSASSSQSPSAPPRAASLNVLFGLLGTMESSYPSHRTIVLRSPTGNAAGLLSTHAGRVNGASTPWERNSLAEAIASVLEVPPSRAAELAAGAVRAGASPFTLLGGTPGIAPEALRKIALRTTAQECLRIAESCGTEPPRLLPLAGGVPEGAAFHPLELFMEAAGRMDVAAPDFASEVYSEFASVAEAGVLLLRPADASQLPVPISAKGFDEASLADVVPLCMGAVGMCLPEALLRAGERPMLSTRLMEGGTWVSAVGAKRLALLRLHSTREVARLLAGVAGRVLKGAS